MEWYFIALIAAAGVAVMMTVLGTIVFFGMTVVRGKKSSSEDRPSLWEKESVNAGINNNTFPYKKEITAGREYIRSHAAKVFRITSYDGLTLSARLVPAECEQVGIILMMHGFRSNPINDFSLAVSVFCERGFSCVLPDQRAHGESGGKYICFGTKEKYDVKSWCEFLSEEYPGVPVILDGISMGATSVLMASSLSLPENVKGIIADCGFTSPIEIWKCVTAARYGISPFPFVYTTGLAAALISRFNIRESTVKMLEKNTLPILFAHGKADTFVPYGMSLLNYEKAIMYCDCELFTSDEAEHGLSFAADREGYLKALDRLIGKCIK